MSDIIFKKNRPKYFFFILVFLILIISLSYFGILWMLNPSKYVSVFTRNEVIVSLVGILAILGALLLSLIIIKSISNRNFFIRINDEGLFLGILQYTNNLIYWKDITGIEIVEINKIKNILVYINNIEYYKNREKGLGKFFFISNTKKYGTPYVINTNALSAKIDDITEVMIENWEKFK
ncbi:hypothetical protein SAMN05421856_1196 [Chryseobacterium taichungense]|uniref:Uncharacterized protein n=1 Tax=Chryseobacterium taichungense TaxID=295069 RepID=A0A1H8DWN7_9FLAO|nr:STM3941 family protein [Chryseobacterium taichungense]SEN11623.1 hypothetical protein SAMN05421856_1196 [Chryseobacterium taichungense]